jgi:hypothetical protein
MPKAHEVAIELRRIADSMDQHPDVDLPQPSLAFYCDTKDQFIGSALFVPRPMKKTEDTHGEDRWKRIRVRAATKTALDVNASVEKALTCELVAPARPAVYRCDPILSML